MASRTGQGDGADHTVLLLPFIRDLYTDTEPVLPLIHRAAATSTLSTTIIFSSPTTPGIPQDPTGTASSGSSTNNLYTILRKDPKSHWHAFQAFLGTVYAALAAGQWSAGKVLMDVEVQFDDGTGGVDEWRRRLRTDRAGEWRILTVDERISDAQGFAVTRIHAVLKDLFPETVFSSDLQVLREFSRTTHQSPTSQVSDPSPSKPAKYPTSALGGTFDHLHAAHKLLLHLGLFISSRKLIVGVMADNLLSGKSNADLVQSLDERIAGVKGFLERLLPDTQLPVDSMTPARGPAQEKKVSHEESPQEAGTKSGNAIPGDERMILDVVEILDPYGPTRTDPDIQALIVSRETVSGGDAVNKVRREGKLSELEVFVIDVIASEGGGQYDHDDDDDDDRGPRSANENKDDDGEGLTSTGDRAGVTRKTTGTIGSRPRTRARNLNGVHDEKELKDLKMGSTAIRQWIREHGE